MRQPITCYIRTLNEARRIGDVIDGAFKVASEVLVIDSGSTDATIAIAKAHGARVIDQPWLGNGKQKRVGEREAQYDWLLDLDADEVVSDALAQSIRDVFDTDPPLSALYSLNVTTVPPIGGPWHGYGGADRVKIYNKTFIRIPDHKAWDQFDVPAGAQLHYLRAPLYHYSFKNIAHLLDKQNRNTSVRARETRLKHKAYIIMRIMIGFPFYFFKAYILKGFIRGGVYGFACAVIIALGRWLKDVKMYEKHHDVDI